MPAPVITAGTNGFANFSTDTSVTVAKPTGILAGDVLLAVIAGPYNVTDSTGDWTFVQSSSTGSAAFINLTVFKRIADGTEDASYTFAHDAARAVAVILRCAGSSDIHVSAITNTTTSASATWPSVTTTVPACALVLLDARKFAVDTAVTPPAGATLLRKSAIAGLHLDVVTASQEMMGISDPGVGAFPFSGQYTSQTLAIASNGDFTAPSVPAGLEVTGTTDRSVALSWSSVSDSDLSGYRVYRNDVLVSDQQGLTCNVGDLPASTSSTWKVSAYDELGNESSLSAGVVGTTNSATTVHAGISTPGEIVEAVLGAPFITLGAPGTWNSYQNREHGNAVLDPADPDANRRYKFPWSGLAFDGGEVRLGIAFSGDGLTWTQHPGNPVSGTESGVGNKGEDPYIAKHIDTGYAYRDGAGRLLMFCEEKPSSADSQRGVWLYRSSDNGMTWSSHGRVLDYSATPGAWDVTDRTSPVVFHDGTQLVMLYEGRNFSGVGVTNNGMIGVAYSSDHGLTWTIGNGGNPIIDTAVNVSTWGQGGVVCDDIIRLGGVYYLTLHGQAVGAAGPTSFNNAGRWKCLNSNPSTWTTADWVEIPGNPYDTDTSTQMFVGNDGGRIITERNRLNLYVTTLDAVDIPFIGWGVPL